MRAGAPARRIGSTDLIDRLQIITTSLEAKADEAAARAAQAVEVIRRGIGAVLASRGLACSEEERARIAACDDPEILQGWLLAAATATTVASISGE